ncbi:MAG: hypothetical protein NT027_13710 [Proteobacteria bacterium]|nr:hypothetical protein [Pseudomonadota bacterium]
MSPVCRFLVFTSVFGLNSVVALGAESKQPKPDSGDVWDDVDSADSSESARSGQKFGLGLLYTPASDFVLSSGVYGASYLSSKLQVGARYIGGSKKLDVSETQGTTTYYATATLTGYLFDIDARYFVGNSFNILGGLGFRSANIKYSIEDRATTSVSGNITISSIVLPISIGNSWTWSNGFSIGCDWLGVQVPLSGSTKSSLSGTLSADTAKKLNEDLVNTGDKLAKTTSLTLLLTHLAWAF